ncbi:hypothetical protein ATK78_0180 [Pedobacter metabolipauper]|uniref:Cellulase (Glycosyl hydrolase family 5) n=2 Tax=Pedobacter metabolipauper TaxID=425513 RepID=A0A4R6SXD8_9SPHI|nr:hypothetical protein ATK78_0180 [Pedobacter metabolipauper]
MLYKRFVLSLVFLLIATSSFAQQPLSSKKTGIYVDQYGVIRWEKGNKEAAFFGVNYTVPFAYGYRSVKRTGITAEQAIRDDVYHFSRLGLDAFRVHVWDTEISDSAGNLLNNEHLRLFDFLIAELKKRNIKTLVTPIAYWGNGYPEKDEDRGGFSSKYGKQRALVEEAAFVAQERYLKQFFQHKNPYTGLIYQDDPDILAAEVNNEPQHSGPKERATEYVNRMVKAIRGTGWTKPIFYNISESPKYADAIVKADVQGHSFQWYPTGLVSGHTLKGNYLPNVSKYVIPFDTIPAFKNRAKIVYEFDAGDILDSYMYPAMAKSFRMAGFQWATQFAYDPMATAYGNTEYQTHYLNLAYTPSKAISLLIASKAFHDLPRSKVQTSDTLFAAFRLSYKLSLSEMNTEKEFYYSNTTTSIPLNISKLKHMAGVGNSAAVVYQGSGAYFLDKIETGVWRLEVMPDAIKIRDPFAKTAEDRAVTGIDWQQQAMQLNFPDLGSDFTIKAMNTGNVFGTTAVQQKFNIQPGTYLVIKKGKKTSITANTPYASLKMGEYVAPAASAKEFLERSAAQIIQESKQTVAGSKSIKDVNDLRPLGILRAVRALTTLGENFLPLFDPALDQEYLTLYNPDWKNNGLQYIPGETSSQQLLKLTVSKTGESSLLGFQSYVGDHLKLNPGNLRQLTTLVIRVKTTGANPAKIKIGLIDADAHFFSTEVSVGSELKDIEIPLSSLKQDSQLLLPRPYPGFLPLYYRTPESASFQLKTVEKLEVSFNQDLEIASVYLK